MAGRLNFIVVIAFASLSLAIALEDCPCELLESDRYPGTLKWDCESLHLVSVPGQCYDIADNVTELYLTDNTINNVRNVDFAGLSDLKALYIDYNQITFFDPSALAGISLLEYFHAEQNPDMEFPEIALKGKKNLIEVVMFGSATKDVPDITDARSLQKLDVRSCSLSTLPRPMVATSLTTDHFDFFTIGNLFVDVAADIISPFPNNSTLNFDENVLIWAADQIEKYDLIDKNFDINIDLETSIKVCNYDGSPTDKTMC